MESSLNLLSVHFARYPAMQAQDAVKLLFQSHFGAGHFISARTSARERLLNEWKPLKKDMSRPAFESIGNGYYRAHIIAFESGELDALLDIFVRAAQRRHNGMDAFEAALDGFVVHCMNGRLPISLAVAAEYVSEYRRQGCPVVGHSDIFRSLYRPAYRVIGSAGRQFFADKREL